MFGFLLTKAAGASVIGFAFTTAVLTLVIGVLGLSLWLPLPRHSVPTARLSVARVLVLCFAIPAPFGVLSVWESGRDVVHLYWMAQIPLSCLFLTSGVLLAQIWRDDRLRGRESSAFDGVLRASGAAIFLVSTWAIALAPLVAEEIWPPETHVHRASGSPTRAVVQMVVWSFGGDLPECLIPFASAGLARGVGYPPRDVTVPLGTLLIASWTSIAFVALAFMVRRIRSRHARVRWCVTLPPAIGTLFLFVDVPVLFFEPGFFGPTSTFHSGIWESDVLVMRSLGWVMLAAAAAVTALVVALGREREDAAAQRE